MEPLAIISVLFFCALAVWALVHKQPIDEISLGNSLKAKFKDRPADESVTFTVSWEIEKYVVEARAKLTISGSEPVTLAVSRSQPFQTVSVRVPAPGQYAYSLEQQELRESADFYFRQVNVPTALTGKGLIDVNKGVSFEIRSTWVTGPQGATVYTHLQPVGLHVLEAGRRQREAKLKSNRDR